MLIRTLTVLLIIGLVFPAQAIFGSERINYLTDIRAVYLYERPDNIDWPLVYHLAVESGCRVDLVTLLRGPDYQKLERASSRYNLNSYRFLVPDKAPVTWVRICDDLFGELPPDFIIFSGDFERTVLQAFEDFLLSVGQDSTYAIDIKKFYRSVAEGTQNDVYIKSRDYYSFKGVNLDELAGAVGMKAGENKYGPVYTVHRLIQNNIGQRGTGAGFLSGIDQYKFDAIVEGQVSSQILKSALKDKRDDYFRALDETAAARGSDKITALIEARKALAGITQVYYYQISQDSTTLLARYLESRRDALAGAILNETGLISKAGVIFRTTPEGRRLKCRMELTNNSSTEISVGYFNVSLPNLATEYVFDSAWTKIFPGRTYIREYALNIDPGVVATATVDSMQFRGRIKLGKEELDFVFVNETVKPSSFFIETIPDFILLRPFNKNQVDRLVEQTEFKILLHKPAAYSGRIRIDIQTPPQVKTGAFEKEMILAAGDRMVEVSIPTVATRSLPDQLHDVTVSITADNDVLATGQLHLRQKEFRLPAQKGLALFPDRDGVLEDILMAGGADYRAVSDHYLKAGDFGLYDMLIFGSGCFYQYHALELIREKVRKYLEYGGTVLVFGQPDDWREDFLPISIIPTSRNLDNDGVRIVRPNDAAFKGRMNVSPEKLLEHLSVHYLSYPAVVFPSDNIIAADNNLTLLSVSRVGQGRLIYCGLPLMSMFRDLHPEAIDLFTNLIELSRK